MARGSVREEKAQDQTHPPNLRLNNDPLKVSQVSGATLKGNTLIGAINLLKEIKEMETCYVDTSC